MLLFDVPLAAEKVLPPGEPATKVVLPVGRPL